MEKAGRNDPCPCGSGKKYKKCCGKATPKKINATVLTGSSAANSIMGRLQNVTQSTMKVVGEAAQDPSQPSSFNHTVSTSDSTAQEKKKNQLEDN